MAISRGAEPSTLPVSELTGQVMVCSGGNGSAGFAGTGAFVSMASELVDEAAHPLEQLEALDKQVAKFEALGDTDAVVECRIKQKALHQVLVYLYRFPLQPLIRAQAQLAEAYAAGGYFKQANAHLAQAREVCAGGIYDDAQSQGMQCDLLIAEGAVHLSRNQFDVAHNTLLEAAKLLREVYGEMDQRACRIHTMLGQIARQQGRMSDASEAYMAAWEVRNYIDTLGCEGSASFSSDIPQSEETLRLLLRIAEVEHLDGRVEEAITGQRKVVQRLMQRDEPQYVVMLVDSSSQLARWLESQGQDREALEALHQAEEAISKHFGAEDAKAVEVKRDAALLHLKLGEHDTALQYLNDVHYFERRLHGSQSTNVARTLKALGTVHMVRRNLGDAEQYLFQALRIFEADHPQHVAIVKDIHAKLGSIAAMARGVG